MRSMIGFGGHPRHITTSVIILIIGALLTVGVGGCTGSTTSATLGTSGGSTPAEASPSTTVRLLTHDSFAVSKDLVEQLKDQTGITLEIVTAGDAGTMVSGAILAAGAPTADVLFGVDNTLVERARAADIFEPYQVTGGIDPALLAGTDGLVTPIDVSDVCINIDDAWFAERGLAIPRSLEDLRDPAYRGLLTVIDPATSSPGLAFLLSTIDRWPDTWPQYWMDLKANDVRVAADWTSAYQSDFTVSGGSRPLVLSYATSPPAEIVYAQGTPPARPRSSVMTDGCFRQVEYAGVLRGTAQPQAARQVVDWLASEGVQRDVPLSMFVFPARMGIELPTVFTDFAARPTNPASLEPASIASNLDTWLRQWDAVMGR